METPGSPRCLVAVCISSLVPLTAFGVHSAKVATDIYLSRLHLVNLYLRKMVKVQVFMVNSWQFFGHTLSHNPPMFSFLNFLRSTSRGWS